MVGGDEAAGERVPHLVVLEHAARHGAVGVPDDVLNAAPWLNVLL